MKIKSVHNEIFVFDSSKMLKVKNKHFKIDVHVVVQRCLDYIVEVQFLYNSNSYIFFLFVFLFYMN